MAEPLSADELAFMNHHAQSNCVRYPDNVNAVNGPLRLLATIKADRARIAELEAQLVHALDALQDLFDEQQGPPLELPRHKASWQAAMDKARTVLAKWPPEEQNND